MVKYRQLVGYYYLLKDINFCDPIKIILVQLHCIVAY